MSRLAPCRCGHPGAGCSCYEERVAEAGWSEWAARPAKPPPPSAVVPDPADVEKVARSETAQGEGDCPDCGHLATWHAAYGCLCCDCTRAGSYVHAPQPGSDGAWTPPATIGGTWTRLNRRTRLYEFWPPSRPAALAAVRPSPARRDRYAQCDDTCTVDCGACKGAGRPSPDSETEVPSIADALAAVEKVRALAADYAQIAKHLHHVPSAELYAEVATELRSALGDDD